MNELDRLLSLIQDPRIDDDAWSDVYIEKALELSKQLRDSGQLNKCLEKATSLDEKAAIRLFEVITEYPAPEMFSQFFEILTEAHGELAEVLIDGLRSWPLDYDQRKQLLLTAERFRGKSKVFDVIIDNLASSVRNRK